MLPSEIGPARSLQREPGCSLGLPCRSDPIGPKPWDFSKVSPTLLPLLPHVSIPRPRLTPSAGPLLTPDTTTGSTHLGYRQESLSKAFLGPQLFGVESESPTPHRLSQNLEPMVLARPLSHKPSWSGRCEGVDMPDLRPLHP